MINRVLQHADIAVAIGVVMVVIMMVLPLPPVLLDVLITINLAVALTVMLLSLYTQDALDLSVFPSLWEGTPLTAFEALSMGRPIVATDADGLLDILTPDHDALVVPRRDAASLAQAIVWAIDHPEARARLSTGARRTGHQFDIDLFVRKMERLYTILHEVSRASARRGVLEADLSFLTSETVVS